MIDCLQKFNDFKQKISDFKQLRLKDLHHLIYLYGHNHLDIKNKTIDVFENTEATIRLKQLFDKTIIKVGIYYLVDNKGELINYDCMSIHKLCDLIDILTFCYNDEINKAKNILIKAGYTITKKGE